MIRRPQQNLVAASTAERIAVASANYEKEFAEVPLAAAYESLRLQSLQRKNSNAEAINERALALACLAIQQEVGPVPYHVQRLAAAVMAMGNVAEMATGEGKTISVGLAAAMVAVRGGCVHVATANSYLARRDCELIGPALARLGLRTRLVETALSAKDKRHAYQADVTYGTADDFAFDFLRDVTAKRQRKLSALGKGRPLELLNRRRHFALIDEIDHILIDEAGTPLVLSNPGPPSAEENASQIFRQADAVAADLMESIDWVPGRSGFTIQWTAAGLQRVAQHAPKGIERSQLLRPWQEYVQHAVEARQRVVRDIDYVVVDGKIQIIDPATGRIQPDRQWQAGLHQAVEVKESVAVSAELDATAQISCWRFFDLYQQLGGCSGTALDAKDELLDVYGLQTLNVPLRIPSRRQVLPTSLFHSQQEKYESIAIEIGQVIDSGRPVLLGTESIRQSEELATFLRLVGYRLQVLNGIQDAEEADIVAAAGDPGAITIATDLAGRGTDIKISPAVEEAGGLHVIVVSPRKSPRLDRQLIGRAARQGQPGTARTFICLEDSLVQEAAPAVRDPGSLPAIVRRAARRADKRAVAARAAMARRDMDHESFFHSSNAEASV